MRVLITGSRDWTDDMTIYSALAEIKNVDKPDSVTLVSGACPTGADIMAEGWARRFGWEIERHPAQWKTYGKSAGFRRNKVMVDLGADVCLAFVNPCTDSRCPTVGEHGSHGTEMTVGLAEGAGIPVRRWTGVLS